MTESEPPPEFEFTQPRVTVRAFYEGGEISTVAVEFTDVPGADLLSRTIAQFVVKPPTSDDLAALAARARKARASQARLEAATCGLKVSVVTSPPGVPAPRCPEHECLLAAEHAPASDLAEHRCFHCHQLFGGIPGVTS